MPALPPTAATAPPPRVVSPAPAPNRGVVAAGASETERVSSAKSPDWVKDAVFYQVFPERFRDGDAGNDPAGTVPWGSAPQNDRFFMGGDLNGITQKLDHITKLGANALYLNPIFTSPSNHKYDTTDYSKVDPGFGGDVAFNQLVDKAHASGVKLILDGVLNHTSNEHVWFNDVKQKGPASKYWSWYKVNKHPITTYTDEKGVLRSNDYEGWGKPEWGGPYATLPVLRHDNPEVMNELVTGKDSLVRRWIRDGKIDGWRMDVADEVDPQVWRETRGVVKAENPEAYLVGETWQDASAMVQGDQFDGAMNYKYFQQPAVDFFGKKSIAPGEFAKRLENGYPADAKLAMLNILESHDTPRFITQASGDWYRARPAAIFQMTYQGAPSIYYGAEIGMEGGADPDSRRAFDWNVADNLKPPSTLTGEQHRRGVAPDEKANQLFGLYQRLIDTRKGTDALRRGEFQVLTTHDSDNTMSYRRWVNGDARDAVVAINNNVVGRDVTVPMQAFAPEGTSYTDALSGAKHVVSGGNIKLEHLDGNWGAILLRDV